MVNGPIYFLNKPLGNTIGKKITQKSLSDLLFPRKTCCINYGHMQNSTSCLTGIDKWMDLQLQYLKWNLLSSLISIIWARMPLRKSSKENSFDTGEVLSRCIEYLPALCSPWWLLQSRICPVCWCGWWCWCWVGRVTQGGWQWRRGTAAGTAGSTCKREGWEGNQGLSYLTPRQSCGTCWTLWSGEKVAILI